ncbi:MAG: DDE-type integrase/transposase/recombinase, partial [Verrucomicrobiota bacterium]
MFKSKQRILEQFFWPGVDRDVKEHVDHCVECQKCKPHGKFLTPPLVPLEQPCNPNHRVHIDLFGPLAATGGGKKFIMVMTCAFTKYVELLALPNKEAATVAKGIMDTWVTRYSTPHEIVTDNGREFANQLMEELAKQLGFLHKTTSPYHPQCNASAEVFNRTMRRYIQTAIRPPYLDWEQFLAPLRICYNTSVSKATLATPFSLMFGMDANMPYFDMEPSLTYSESPAGDYVTRLHKSRKAAEDNNIEYRKSYKDYYDRKMKTGEGQLSPDDQIFVLINSKQQFKNPKLQPLYEGPFEVVRLVIPNVYYKKGKKIKVTHLARVKKARLALETLEESQFVRLDEVACEAVADEEDSTEVLQQQPVARSPTLSERRVQQHAVERLPVPLTLSPAGNMWARPRELLCSWTGPGRALHCMLLHP